MARATPGVTSSTSSGSSSSLIPSSMTFGGGGVLPTSAADVASAYQSNYNAALATSQQQYNNTMAGYDNLLNKVLTDQSGIVQGYNRLSKQVTDTLQGSNDANTAMIDKQYAQYMSELGQKLTNAGLTNSTVVASLGRGITFDQKLAQSDSASKYANLLAGYMTDIGKSGLNFQAQAIDQYSGVAQNQLRAMQDVQVQYPDAGVYLGYSNMYGQLDQQNKDRDLMSSLYDQMMQGSRGTAGGGLSGVYGTQATPYYGSSTSAGSYVPQGTSPGGALSPYASSYSGGGNSSGKMLDYTSGYGNIYSGYDDYSWGDYGGGGSF